MVELYMEKGLSKADAETVIKILRLTLRLIVTFSKDKSIFVEVMMKEELQMIPPDSFIRPYHHSLLLFGSTFLFGLFPVAPFLIEWFGGLYWFNYRNLLALSVLISLTSLFVAGIIKVTTFFIYNNDCGQLILSPIDG
jgi:hypothetical protein